MRDAQMKGGSLESGTCHKEKITGQPGMDVILKKSQKPPAEKDRSADRGHKLRSNSQGY
jgi:hypothetical protein